MSERASEEYLNSLRRPKIIYTTAYLNDPIRFETDERFDAESALRFADPEIPIVNRDDADFAIVDLNNTGPQYYAVDMYLEKVNRTDFEKFIMKKRKIMQLLADEDA